MRHLVTQACCAVGGVVGLWLGFLSSLGEARPAETLLSVGWHVLAGVAVGAACAWTVTVVLPWSWSGRR